MQLLHHQPLLTYCAENVFRKLIVSAIGENEHVRLLAENRNLKLENAVLKKVRERIGGVTISHPDGDISMSLLEGMCCTPFSSDRPQWKMLVSEKGNSLVSMGHLKDIEVFISGVVLNRTALVEYIGTVLTVPVV